MKERVFSALARLFYACYAFFSSRASALREKRITSTYVDRRVRVTCGQTHYGCVLDGTWVVTGYDDCCGDLKVSKVLDDCGCACVGSGIQFNNYVKPECVEVVS